MSTFAASTWATVRSPAARRTKAVRRGRTAWISARRSPASQPERHPVADRGQVLRASRPVPEAAGDLGEQLPVAVATRWSCWCPDTTRPGTSPSPSNGAKAAASSGVKPRLSREAASIALSRAAS